MGEIAADEAVGSAVRRMVVKVLSLGAVAALAGLGASGRAGAVGAFAGCLAAGAYITGYLRSHVHRREMERTFDPRVAKLALVRVVVIATGAFGVFVFFDKPGLRAYLLAFIASFPLLLASEAPRALRQLRARGIIG